MHLSGLACYPVKSCAAIPLQSAALTPTGLEHDRSFMVVRPDGAFLTQRERPQLAVVRPAIHDQVLTVTVPTGATWSTDLTQLAGDPLPVVVFDDDVVALDQGDEAADVLSAHLTEPVRLVRIDPGRTRSVAAAGAAGASTIAFADGYPLLLTTESSLAELNRRMPVPLPMNRFRPNLVVAGSGPFSEDDWCVLQVGDVVMEVAKPCARCAITTVDQATGRRDSGEPLRTLGTFRRGTKGVLFGTNVVHRGPGRLRVGDPVRVLETAASGG